MKEEISIEVFSFFLYRKENKNEERKVDVISKRHQKSVVKT